MRTESFNCSFVNRYLLKVHLTPEIFFFAQTNPLTVWIIFSDIFFDLVKTLNFHDLLNLTKIGSRPRKERSGASKVVT